MIVKVEKAQPLYEKQKSEGDELREIEVNLIGRESYYLNLIEQLLIGSGD